MFYYFGYGSNMNLAALRAKGVEPLTSVPARLEGWSLTFNVQHFFQHEGGVANIVRTSSRDAVQGVLHACESDALAPLDAAEAFGVGYDRITVDVSTVGGRQSALTYVGMPSFLDDGCLPSRRYLNIVCAGAEAMGLDQTYIERLRSRPVHRKADYPPFDIPAAMEGFDSAGLAAGPCLTALAGAVFDMSRARPRHDYLRKFFGGKDMTLFHLKRMDSSKGDETEDDIVQNRLDAAQRLYLNEYLHEYCSEYRLAGVYLPHLKLINPETRHIL